jgi:hypothetical protein
MSKEEARAAVAIFLNKPMALKEPLARAFC